ncbi:hypothetical protein ACFXPX_10280 [Kitasatospora sp. NPDC059146]|uniref:hypothetical protein n=1 Tax=unclassified Kitasatospora TaxID=2633591 RepID=UPI0036CB97F4
MDSGIRAMVDAVDEARRQLRENALPKAKDRGRDKVPAVEAAVMLGELADLVEVTGELAAALSDRMATHESPEFYRLAGVRLRDEAGHLREAEQRVAKRVG